MAAIFVASLLIGACSPTPDSNKAAATPTQPNIILILIDDMGYNDLGANGNPNIKTPNLNRLAGEGVRFTRHYTDSTCTASRIGIMTGAPPAHQGFRPDNIGLSPELVTLPEMLREAEIRGHPLESSGQAGKEKFLDLFSPSIGSLWPYLLVNRYAPKNSWFGVN